MSRGQACLGYAMARIFVQGEKTKAKPTLSLSTSGVGKAKHLSSIPTDHGEVTDKVNDKVETTY